MSDTPKPDAPVPATPPAVDPKFSIKFDGQEVSYDLTNPADRQRLQTDAQLGRFSEKQAAKVQEAQARVAAAEADAQLGKGWREFAAANPEGAAVLGNLMQGIREGRMDPSQVRQALTAQQTGDATALEAQARASADPQTRVLLQSMAAQLQSVQGEVSAFKQTAAQRELDGQINRTLSGDSFVSRSAAAMSQATRRTRELVQQGMDLEPAALRAAQEVKDLANELANAELQRTREGQEFRTVKPSQGLPPIGEVVSKAVDPKAPPRVQQQQRLSALQDRFRAMQRLAEG